MKPFVKTTLTFLVLIGMITAITYLGIKLINLNQAEKSTSISPTTTDSTPSQLPSEHKVISEDKIAIIKQYESCRSSLECKVISEPTGMTPDGQEITSNQCLNAQYLESCSNCREDKGFQAELAKQKNCSCINNICDLTAKDGSDAIPYTE